jgi:Flp pilus assembly protein TadG
MRRLPFTILSAVSRQSKGQERGQALVEFALLVPLLLFLILIVVDFGRIFYTYDAVANSAREGARYWALYPGQTADTQRRAEHELACDSGTTPSVCSTLGVAISSPDAGCLNTQRGCPATVTVSSDFTVLTPFMARMLNPDPTCAGPPPGNPILRQAAHCSPVNTIVVHASATMIVW